MKTLLLIILFSFHGYSVAQVLSGRSEYPIFPGYYRIIGVDSGKLIECVESEKHGGFRIQQRGWDGSAEQEWEIYWIEGEFYKLINRQHRVALDLPLGSTKSGVKLSAWQDVGNHNQQWALEQKKPGRFYIRNRSSGNYLDLENFSLADGAQLQSWSFHGKNNQLWRVERIYPEASGVYYLQNQHIRVGIDLDRGGAISWISEVNSNFNIVNTHDEGRYIQQSYYAGDALARLDEGQAPPWSPFPWNPVQSGDYYGNRSILLDFQSDGQVVYVKTRPVLWDMNREYAQAHIETWIELDQNEIIYTGRITRFLSRDIWGEREGLQELPAVYLHKNLNQYFSYTGDNVWREQLNPLPTHKIWGVYETKESWVACVNQQLWGLGVFAPGYTIFNGGFYNVGIDDDPTAHITPRVNVTLPKTGSFTFTTYMTVGQLSEIMHRIYLRRASLMREGEWVSHDEEVED